MEKLIESTKQALTEAKGRLLKTLSFVPHEKLNWSPGPTAKSALRIAAHCAKSNEVFEAVIQNQPLAVASFPELLAHIDMEEQKLTTRDDVVAALEESTNRVLAAMDSLTPARASGMTETSFISMPMAAFIQVPLYHLQNHAGQIDYLQTIWGDLAEDVVQDALLQALRQWPFSGIPDNPRAWLIQVARNKALDLLRREASLRRVEDQLLQQLPEFQPGPETSSTELTGLEDDELAMIFACCQATCSGERWNRACKACSSSERTFNRRVAEFAETDSGLAVLCVLCVSAVKTFVASSCHAKNNAFHFALPSPAGRTGPKAMGPASVAPWHEASLYDQLIAIAGSPVVALNRAIAESMVAGPEAGLRSLEELNGDPAMRSYYLMPAVRADLFRRRGRTEEAAACYRQALSCSCTEPERRFLLRRLEGLS